MMQPAVPLSFLLRLASFLAATQRAAATWNPLGGRGCFAQSLGQCLAKPGCRWFEYDGEGPPCPLCEAAFGDQSGVTGCRDWDPASYCQSSIFQAAQKKYGGNPSDGTFRQALHRYSISMGSGEAGNPHNKVSYCSVWCDYSWPFPCFGQPRSRHEVRGVNYGGRFVPEYYLGTPGIQHLFAGVTHPQKVKGKVVPGVSLCDLGQVSDASERMAKYLDRNVREDHFSFMAKSGFNVVRLPLGYWNLIRLPGTSAPNGACHDRWLQLQRIMSPSNYTKWIEMVFEFAGKNNMTVMLDLHGAPGAQEANVFTGCNLGKGNFYWDTPWNIELAVRAVEEMAKLCHRHAHACYGIELLNEPSSLIPRAHLVDYYRSAIEAARQHLSMDTPLIVMEWTTKLFFWRNQRPFSYARHGRILFSTHVYDFGSIGVQEQAATRKKVSHDMSVIAQFHATSIYDIIVTEYALSGHGRGSPETDFFDYNSLANWYVHQFNQHGLGSMVWNFDSSLEVRAWGPVAAADRLGSPPVNWNGIFTGQPVHVQLASPVSRQEVCTGNAVRCWIEDQSAYITAVAAVASVVAAISAIIAASKAQQAADDRGKYASSRLLQDEAEEGGGGVCVERGGQDEHPGSASSRKLQESP